ncbi:MAG: sulfatase-like hydrolase/transferase, partial [Verrucomicrobiota bacterium]
VFRKFCQRFFAMARTAHQPFFLMASSHDPHRPFGRGKAGKKPDERADPSRTFDAADVTLSGLLPDLPESREEFAAYATSVRRLDDMVGAVLKELENAGLADETMVVFLSDHGMPFPGAKFNCYPDSVRTPLIIRWPGKVAPGSVEKTHMISMIDLQPTTLEAVGLEPGPSDGRSFLPLLFGEAQEGRDAVYAQFHHIHGKDALPMRSVITRSAAYVFNPWSNGERRFTRLGGSAFAAMKQRPEMAARVKHLEYRVVEEFFDRTKDPHCLENRIAVRDYQGQIQALQSKLRTWMVATEDPALEAFERRDQSQAMETFVQEYRAAAQRAKDELRSYEREKGYRF